MEAIIADLRRRCAGPALQIVTLDVAHPAGATMAEGRGIHAVPTFLFLDAAGREVSRLVGEQSPVELEAAMSAHVGGGCDG